MQKVIAVMGATDQQGGSVVNVMLAAGWKVRGITRDVNSAKAKALVETGVEVVAAKASDETALRAAFAGAQAIFAMTAFWDPVFSGTSLEEAASIEERDALTIARAAAVTDGLEHYIFASLHHSSKISGGKISVSYLDSKARADEKIRETMPALAARMTSLFFGFYPSNFFGPPFKSTELPGTYGKHALILPTTPNHVIRATGDMTVTPGIWVRQILVNPQLTWGKYAGVATEAITLGDLLRVWTEHTGKSAVFIPCDADTFVELWGPIGNQLVQLMKLDNRIKDWSVGVEDKWLSQEDLGITAD